MKRILKRSKDSLLTTIQVKDESVTLILGERVIEAQVTQIQDKTYLVNIKGHTREVRVEHLPSKTPSTTRYGTFTSSAEGVLEFESPLGLALQGSGSISENLGLLYPLMPGRVVSLMVKKGDQVKEGQTLLILEAMKMQNEVKSPINGIVKEIYVAESSTVDIASPMIEVV